MIKEQNPIPDAVLLFFVAKFFINIYLLDI